jgi:KDO2-lipid IV(A) lauroyltransferase
MLSDAQPVGFTMWILFYKTTSFLAKILPRSVALFITDRLTEGAYFISFRRARPVAFKNLSFALRGLREEGEVKLMIMEQFRQFAWFIYDFLVLPYLDGQKLRKMYELVGFSKVVEALKEGNGIIILTGHLGNWELGASALVNENIPVTAVSMPHTTEMVTRFFYGTRLSRGVDSVSVDRAARIGLKVLRANECLAILGDRDFTGTGAPVDFLGGPTVFPVGAMKLAAKTGATICPAFAIRTREGRYRIYFEDTYRVRHLEDGTPDLKSALRRWSIILGKYVRLFPTQWFRFDSVWE